MRRGVRLLWLSVRAQRGPFALAVVGAALFAVMAVGGTVVLGRVTDDVLTPAFEEGGVERSAVAIGRRGHRRGVRCSAWSAWCCAATSGRWRNAGCRCCGSGG